MRSLCSTTPRKLEREVRIELIQDGVVKGWSPSVNTEFEPEGSTEVELTAESWTWKDESTSHTGDYTVCVSMRNSYGEIWIPMGQGRKISISDSAGIDAVMADDNFHDAIYDLHGRKVTDDVNTLAPGIYIRRHNGVASKIIAPLK